MNKIFKALSDPTRRKVLELLRDGPKPAGELAEHFQVSKPTMSAHFTILTEAGLVARERDGKMIIYWLQLSVLEDALLAFTDIFGITQNKTDTPAPSPTSISSPKKDPAS